MNRDEFLELQPGTLIINKNTNEKCILFSNGMEDGLGNIFHIAIKEVVVKNEDEWEIYRSPAVS